MPSEETESVGKPPSLPEVVGGKFRVRYEIGSGSYSEVYLGTNITSGDDVAIKIEWQKAEKGDKLLGEVKYYEQLGRCSHAPRVYWSGVDGEYNIMVMERLGPSLDKLFKDHKISSLSTTLMVAIQVIDRLEYVHARGILYRDIKPHNFVVGVGARSNHIYILDFGLAKRYLDKDGRHVHCSKKKRSGITGTVRYSGLFSHAGVDSSRRDDLEATGYMLLHFLRGDLPWLGLKAASKRSKHRKIHQKKMDTTDEELCDGQPREFIEYFRYCRGLGFEETPNYSYLRSLFERLLDGKDLRSSSFDWVACDEAEQRSQSSRRRSRRRDRNERPQRRRRSRSPRERDR